jgi:hypothetical protein
MTSTVDLRPGKLNVKSSRGDTVALPIVINEAGAAADLTGRTFLAQIRRTKPGDVIVDIDVDDTDAATGELVLRIDSADTEPLSGGYVWDLEQTIGDNPRTILAGTWTFEPDVTREEAS